MRAVLLVAIALALAGVGLEVATGTADARCIVGYGPGCIVPPPCLPGSCCGDLCPPPPA